ncbi:glycosidase [Candidatus Marinimicrobia bacterium MT.SAG.2]|nr:glycosidase [Candidatus Marinimicrobia bacterium MT.SAG.2]
MKLKRFIGNPILEPRGDDWESVAVFNPSAVYKDGKIHLYYRAVGEYHPYTSRLGYAVFDKDLNLLERQSEPAMIPDAKMWERSLEDPRVTEIEGDLYLTYITTPTPSPPSAVRKRLGIPMPEHSAHPRTALAKIKKFNEFERYGIITPYGADERDVVLFPEKIGGKYAMLDRPANWVGEEYGTSGPSIWFATTDSIGQKITDHKLVMKAEAEWEGNKLGAGPPPIRTESGWLLIYHGVDDSKVYRAGAALLDLEEPWNVIARTGESVFEPVEDYEKYGDVPNVVFPEGMVVVDETLIVFYGAADKVCCAASVNLDEFIKDLLSER